MPHPGPKSFEDYLTVIPPDKEEGTREILALMRSELPGAREDVRWGIAIFSRGGSDIVGISARKDFYSLYVPDPATAERFVPGLGKVKAGRGCIRFRTPEDLEKSALRRMVAELEKASAEGHTT